MDTEQRRVFLAILLSGLVLFAWQAWFVPRNTVPMPEQKTAINRSEGIPRRGTLPSSPLPPKRVEIQKRFVSLAREGAKTTVSNFLTVENMAQKGDVATLQEIIGTPTPFSIELLTPQGSIPLEFDFYQQQHSDHILGHNKAHEIALKIYQEASGKVFISLDSSRRYRYRAILYSSPKDIGNARMREFIALKDGEVERNRVGSSDRGRGPFSWFGVDFNYHLFAWVSVHRSFVEYQTLPEGNMLLDTVAPTTSYQGYLVFSKKNYDHLATLGDNLQLSVDFGFFGILALPILRGLQFFYQYVANYGLSIIIVTLIIRLITFPLQFFSFRSMKRMQKLQPQLNTLRSKYKEDPKKMQEETMKLFRQSKVNPLGGCFPMLLQMPVFFAFYQVLYNAVELVEAPFYFWIKDLSIKDPYYVLPLLMMATMFLQSKFTPSMSSVDSTQKKIMYILPIVFGFFMKDLPAGLNLYFTVSMLFGMLQQFLVYRTVAD